MEEEGWEAEGGQEGWERVDWGVEVGKVGEGRERAGTAKVEKDEEEEEEEDWGSMVGKELEDLGEETAVEVAWEAVGEIRRAEAHMSRSWSP